MIRINTSPKDDPAQDIVGGQPRQEEHHCRYSDCWSYHCRCGGSLFDGKLQSQFNRRCAVAKQYRSCFTSGSPNTKQHQSCCGHPGLHQCPSHWRLVRCRIPAKRRPENERCSGSSKKIYRLMCPTFWRNGSDSLWRPFGLPMDHSMIQNTPIRGCRQRTSANGASVETCVNGEVTRSLVGC